MLSRTLAVPEREIHQVLSSARRREALEQLRGRAVRSRCANSRSGSRRRSQARHRPRAKRPRASTTRSIKRTSRDWTSSGSSSTTMIERSSRPETGASYLAVHGSRDPRSASAGPNTTGRSASSDSSSSSRPWGVARRGDRRSAPLGGRVSRSLRALDGLSTLAKRGSLLRVLRSSGTPLKHWRGSHRPAVESILEYRSPVRKVSGVQ